MKEGRPLIYTPEVVAQIQQWVDGGVSREQIAVRLGTTVGRLAANCSYRKISLTTRKRRVPLPSGLEVQWLTIRGLEQEAERRGWTVSRLVAELLDTTHRDDLYKAVLDQ